jgi:hypothetical protein
MMMKDYQFGFTLSLQLLALVVCCLQLVLFSQWFESQNKTMIKVIRGWVEMCLFGFDN